jgi:hypothetical protein
MMPKTPEQGPQLVFDEFKTDKPIDGPQADEKTPTPPDDETPEEAPIRTRDGREFDPFGVEGGREDKRYTS